MQVYKQVVRQQTNKINKPQNNQYLVKYRPINDHSKGECVDNQ